MAGPGKVNVVKTPDWPATKMTPLRCYEKHWLRHGMLMGTNVFQIKEE